MTPQQLVDLVSPVLPIGPCRMLRYTESGHINLFDDHDNQMFLTIAAADCLILGAIAEACEHFEVTDAHLFGRDGFKAKVILHDTEGRAAFDYGPTRLHAAVSAYLSAKGNT